MQTDPNPSNFSYNIHTDQLNLLDFGAARSYKDSFIDYYWQVIKGSVE
jgi:aarF domain-containing kinase